MKLPACFGHVRIELFGGYPERWLNLAAEQGIALWDIHRQDTSLFCRVASADYRRLRPLARRTGVRMRVREKRGILHRFRRRRLRVGILGGTLVFLLLLQLLSSRIWVIRVIGNRTLPDDVILTTLAAEGIREGASFAAVDLTELRLTALQRLPEVTWLGVHQSGSILTVEVTERSDEAPIGDTAPANVVASCDGVILSINTVCGQAMVTAGDAVRKGDLLISGVTESKVGPTLKRADGTVLARVSHTLTVTVPLRETVSVPAHEICRSSLLFFGMTIPLYTNAAVPAGHRTVIERHPLTVGDVPLPLGIVKTRLCYDATAIVTRSVEEASAEAEKRLANEERELFATFTADRRSLSVQASGDAVTLTAVYDGTREIGESVPIQ